MYGAFSLPGLGVLQDFGLLYLPFSSPRVGAGEGGAGAQTPGAGDPVVFDELEEAHVGESACQLTPKGVAAARSRGHGWYSSSVAGSL